MRLFIKSRHDLHCLHCLAISDVFSLPVATTGSVRELWDSTIYNFDNLPLGYPAGLLTVLVASSGGGLGWE